MTYFDTQQQNAAHNSQFNPQAWAAFNSQAAQPHGPWTNAPWMQAIGGFGQGGLGPGKAVDGPQNGPYMGETPFVGLCYLTRGGGAHSQLGPEHAPLGQWGRLLPMRTFTKHLH